MGLLEQLTYDPQMALGMGLLGASGPSRMPVSLGQGLASAWGNMQEVAKEKQRADLMALQAKQADLGVQKGTLEMQQLLRQQEALKRIAEKFANPSSGQAQSTPSAPYGGGYSPSVAATFGVPAGSPQAAQPQPDAKQNQFQRYMAMADAFDAEQLPELANKYREHALKLMPKYKTDNGFAINPATGKLEMWSTNDQSGKPEFVGVAPKPDISIEDLGGKKIVIDRNNIKPGTDYTKTMTPGEVASNQLGWANFGKPSIHNVEGVGMLAVGPNGIAKPVTANGKPVVQDKPLNEAQGKAATFADMMASAERIMDDPKLADNQKPEKLATAVKAIPSFGVGGAVGNQIESANRQVVRQAQETWVRAALRKESGAVIGPEEMAQEIRTFFPQIGDSPEVIAQKAQLRKLKQQGIAREAGAGYKPGGMPVGQSSSGVIDFSQLRK